MQIKGLIVGFALPWLSMAGHPHLRQARQFLQASGSMRRCALIRVFVCSGHGAREMINAGSSFANSSLRMAISLPCS